MTLLTSILGGSSGGGSPTLIGEYKPIITGNTRQLGIANTANANTIVESSGGIWVRAGQVYPQTTYPELFARLGFVNTAIGLTRTVSNHPLGATFTGSFTGSVAYSPDDDLYLFPMSSNGGNVIVSNSSMQQFLYKQVGGGNTVVYYQTVYGGAPGAKRFLITSNGGTYTFYGTNSTVSGPVATTSNMTNIIFGAANTAGNTTVVCWYPGVYSNGYITVSTDSGASWSNINTNATYVNQVAYGNGIYILQSYPGWVETSTNALKWTGLQKYTNVYQYITHSASYNHYYGGYNHHTNIPVGTITDGQNFMPRVYINSFKALGNTFVAAALDPAYGYLTHYSPGTTGYGLPTNYTSASGNNFPSAIYTSTDARTWEYRSYPFTTAVNSQNHSNVIGDSRITAVGGPAPGSGSSANNIFAAKTWWNYYATSAQHGHFCDHWDHDGHHCAHDVTSYSVTASSVPYNRIYNATPANTSNISANLYQYGANAHSSDDSYFIRAIAYGNSQNGSQQYVYTTSGGTISSSTDGMTWSQRVTGLANTNGIAYGRANSLNTYMVVGNSGLIITSNDVANWTTRTTAYSLDANGWIDVAYGNGTFVLIGNTGNLAISNDGVTFSGVNSTATITGAAYGNSKFVISMASGVMKYSIDGVFWKNTGSTGQTVDLQAVATDNTKFVYVGLSGKTGYASNLDASWTNGTITSSNNFFSVYYGNGTWLMGGANGSIFTSTDGITWTYRTSGTSNTILSVYYANNTYLYGGDNVLATSTDAVTWAVRNANATGALRISSLAYGNGVFVYGSQGFYGTSTDGVTWVTAAAGSRDAANANVANTLYTGQINDIVYSTSNNVFVAVGSGGYIATSPNGSSWAVQNSRTGESLTGLTYGNSRFLSVGTSGTAKISPNGILWSGQASNGNIYGIAFYSNTNVNTFIIVGSTSSVLPGANSFVPTTTYTLETSTDGVYWSTKQMKTTIPAQKVAATNTTAAIMEFCNDNQLLGNPTPGYYYANSQRISISYTGDTWSGLGLPANTWNHLTFANGQFFATGVYGLVANSTDGLFWTTTNVGSQFSTTSSNTSANVPAAYTGGIGIVWTNSFGALKYHTPTAMYILPFKQGGIHFTSKDLITWTPRYTMLFSTAMYNNYLTDGPLVITSLDTRNLTYTLNANSYIAATYNVASEFYVPNITALGGAYSSSPSGQVVGPDFGYPKPQSQTFEAAEIVWYVKAKT